ncbi:MAG: tetratricopeptide repeat protein [Defluviitaleaceae bacterium]|nr:tetratricopeptide repeat protein [Defluviitaleaceae bacterium]
MAKLHLAVSQSENIIPYQFSMTGIRVYSLEEALYHCFHHWRQSTQDFLCEPFLCWIENDLGHVEIGAKLREISCMEGFADRFTAFLAVVDYLPGAALTRLADELELWERRQVWEKLAEQGGYWMSRGQGRQAYDLYAKALTYHQDVVLLNNAGVALMHMGSYDQAALHFATARHLGPENEQFVFNLIEAHIFAGDYDVAQDLIEEAVLKNPEHPELYYFRGELHFNDKSYFDAIKLYEKALRLKYDPEYVYKLCDCFMRVRLYDKALDSLEMVRVRDVAFLKKQAVCYAQANNIPKAIKSMETAIVNHGGSGELWTALARLHRMDYDANRASEAIGQALVFSPDDPAAMLEYAKIHKAQGRLKEYQGILGRILQKFKRDYRRLNVEGG